jgi:hypothetical protein
MQFSRNLATLKMANAAGICTGVDTTLLEQFLQPCELKCAACGGILLVLLPVSRKMHRSLLSALVAAGRFGLRRSVAANGSASRCASIVRQSLASPYPGASLEAASYRPHTSMLALQA